MIKILKKNKKKIFLIIPILLIILLTLSFTKSELLDNEVEVEELSDLVYYLDISYDGIDKYGHNSIGKSSNLTSVHELSSGYIYVEDRIPNGLVFNGFVQTETGKITAVGQNNIDDICDGMVVDDEKKEELNNYHGLHYDENTRTVSFKIKNLQAGCKITIGIRTITPSLGDKLRMDFYNRAIAREGNQTATSNTVHAYMQKGKVTLYNVKYEYEGSVPENIPLLPNEAQYMSNSTIFLASEPYVEGYSFNGWKVSKESGEIIPATNLSFVMPSSNVKVVGSFTKLDSYQVSYDIEGVLPEGYRIPPTKEYYPNQDVIVDSLKAGEEYNGYRFSGWTTTDAIQNKDGDFIMPENDVRLVGSFEQITYKVTYEFTGENIPPNSENYLPPSQSYPAGTKVKLPIIEDIPGYHFRGWEEGDNFPMPAEDIIITGEWDIQNGTFAPIITKEIVNIQETYKVGDIVEFKITVTNTASYPIMNVNVVENNERAKFIKGVGYSLRTERLVLIDYLEANTSVDITAQYEITDKDTGVIRNEVEILGAEADDNYNLDLTKEYKANTTFKVYSKLNICKTVENSNDDTSLYQFHITGSNYDSWININSNECKTIYIGVGEYQITEIMPQSYELKDITFSSNLTGKRTDNIGTISIGDDSNYEITFTNKYKRVGFFHSAGRIVNQILSKRNDSVKSFMENQAC